VRYFLPETVETERLLLRTWVSEDAEPLAEIYRQPEYLLARCPLAEAVFFGRARRSRRGGRASPTRSCTASQPPRTHALARLWSAWG